MMLRWRRATPLRRRPRSGRRSYEPDSRPCLENSPVRPDAHRTETNVDVREAHPEQAEPGEHHMTAVQGRDAVVAGFADGFLRHLIQTPADQVPQGVASEDVGAEQDGIHDHHQRADADSEMAVEVHGLDRVPGQQEDQYDRQVEEVAVNVLQNEREGTLAP